MFKTAIITGIAGQDGAYLANFLLGTKYRIVGVSHSFKKDDLRGLKYLGIKKRLNLVKGDIASAVLIKKLLLKYHPQEFYNLAGQSSVAKSWEDPDGTFKINSWAVSQMLQLINQYSPRTKFFECSSAEIFGNAKKVITENNFCFKPLNPYGVSKLAAHRSVKNFRERFGLFACNGILFNHESPLKADFMVSKKIVKSVADIALGLAEKITLGNINVRRDWGYAGDFVKAMWLILQQKRPRDFVICTGKSYSLENFVKEAFHCVGINNWQDHIVIDRTLFRKADVRNMRGSPAKIKKLGWKPRVSFKQLVKMMVDYELEKFKK